MNGLGDTILAAFSARAEPPDPPTTEQANALQSRVSDFVSTLGTLGWTYDRDGEIIDAAGR